MSTTPLPPSIDAVCIGAVEVMHYSAHVSLWRLYEQMGIPHETVANGADIHTYPAPLLNRP